MATKNVRQHEGRNDSGNKAVCRSRYAFFRSCYVPLVLTFFLFCGVFIGCSATSPIKFRKEAFASLKLLNTAATPSDRELSKRTRLALRSFGLEELVKKSPNQALIEIQKQVDREPTLDLIYAVAELSFLEARRRELLDPKVAIEYYLVSSIHAFGYLFDRRFQNNRNSYDPHFREACLYYNDSLEKILRLLGRISGDKGQTVDLSANRSFSIDRIGMEPFNIACQHVLTPWNGNDLEPLKFASDYEVKGLQNQSRQYGLGVPMLAHRKRGSLQSKGGKYTPPNLCFPTTALLRFLPPGSRDENGQPLHAQIELYDSLTIASVQILYHNVPLESDLTTPIAYSISDPRIAKMNTFGLVRSDMLTKPLFELADKKGNKITFEEGEEEWASRSIQGLYMMQPHESGKIPVIFIHGLWSSPMAWMEMFNSLRGEPSLRARYEFYFYFYPTGQPFWISAAQFRRELDEFRATFDPQRTDPNFDNIVLVGHSMGGLISHLQTLDSGDEFWNLVSDKTPDLIFKDKTEKSKQEILDWFYFQANPSISRVITIATPHHGSRASNDLTQWFGQKLINLPENVLESVGLTKDGKDMFKKDSLLETRTSIESLSPDQLVFGAMQRRRRQADVRYHNIVGEIEQKNFLKKILPPSDGVVTTESAALERCESQITVQCEHTMIHSHPKTILEVRRILFEHLHNLPENMKKQAVCVK